MKQFFDWKRLVGLFFLFIVPLCGCRSQVSTVPVPAPVSSSSSPTFALPLAGAPSVPAGHQVVLTGPDGTSAAVQVELALTPDEQERGLMYRTQLDPDAGMLFVFTTPQPLSFWMKNTLIPLDVIFFDAAGRFVSFSTMTPCTKDPCATYASAAPAFTALEVNAGYALKHGVGLGWTLRQ